MDFFGADLDVNTLSGESDAPLLRTSQQNSSSKRTSELPLDALSLPSSNSQTSTFVVEPQAITQPPLSRQTNRPTLPNIDDTKLSKSGIMHHTKDQSLLGIADGQPLISIDSDELSLTPKSFAKAAHSTDLPAKPSTNNRIIIKGRKDKVFGTNQNDRINASRGEGHNRIMGKNGDDVIFVRKKDIAKGQKGNDYLDASRGQKSRNKLIGGQGDDILIGHKRDRLIGNAGNDILDARSSQAKNKMNGGAGDDTLYASLKQNKLIGGRGADRFWVGNQRLPFKPHVVKDFNPGFDVLGFDHVNGITQASQLTIAESGSDTLIRFQGRTIVRLKQTASDQLTNNNFIVLSETSPSLQSPPIPQQSQKVPRNQSESPVNSQDDSTIFATYRKDFFFSNEIYNEDTSAPLSGGRVQIAAIAQETGRVRNVFINGVERRVIDDKNPTETPPFEWVHVWPQRATAGQPIWVNFHSRDPLWDSLERATIQVETRNGFAVDGTFAVKQTPIPLTYVTTADDYSRFLIHLQNTDTTAHQVERLWINGVEVLNNPQKEHTSHIIPRRTLAAQSHELWDIPLSKAVKPGDAWTVVVEYANAPPAVGTGRVIPETFPVFAWNNTSERPFPSGELDNYLNIREAGIDTIFITNGTCRDNACDSYDLINNELSSLDDFGGIISYNPFVSDNRDFPDLTDTSGIVAVMTGDETDDRIYDSDTGVPLAAIEAQKSARSWLRYPELPTLNGGKTNKYIGTFAGVSDIQALDFYVAAGAPHVTAFGEHPPLRATFDYLRNARNNHMPLTTWMYTQGLSPVWNKNSLLTGDEFSSQPDPQEILAQGMMAIAAGAKGLAWFQVNQEEAKKAPDRWEAIADVNSMVRAVRPWLREGDVTGAATSDDDTLVEMIQSRDALIVPVISLATKDSPTDIGFLLAQSEEDVPHWIFEKTSPEVNVTIPPDFNITDVFSVQPDGIAEIDFDRSGESITLSGFELDNTDPTELLVLASDDSVRDTINSTFTLPDFLASLQ